MNTSDEDQQPTNTVPLAEAEYLVVRTGRYDYGAKVTGFKRFNHATDFASEEALNQLGKSVYIFTRTHRACSAPPVEITEV